MVLEGKIEVSYKIVSSRGRGFFILFIKKKIRIKREGCRDGK
jgi:hypothetical protein